MKWIIVLAGIIISGAIMVVSITSGKHGNPIAVLASLVIFLGFFRTFLVMINNSDASDSKTK